MNSSKFEVIRLESYEVPYPPLWGAAGAAAGVETAEGAGAGAGAARAGAGAGGGAARIGA